MNYEQTMTYAETKAYLLAKHNYMLDREELNILMSLLDERIADENYERVKESKKKSKPRINILEFV